MKLDIYHYHSALTYFIDSYKNLKSTSEASLREWTEGMGFSSPSLAMDLLKKKRPLKLKYADHLALGLMLNPQERIYFKTMIQLEKAEEDEKAYFEEVLSSLRPRDSFVDKDGGIFSHWLNVVIFTLSQMKDFSMTMREIQGALKQSVSLRLIEDSLNVLIDNQLLRKTTDGKFERAGVESISTPNDVSIKSTHQYYTQIIGQAQSAISMGVDEREFQCFAIGMKKENLGKVKEVMRKARHEIASLSDERGDHVFQFNLNGFPMAEIKSL